MASPVYVGRCDTSLRRRLLEHAITWPDIFFTYEVAHSPEDAYVMECSLFHALRDSTTNIDHPRRLTAADAKRGFCADAFTQIREARLSRT